MPKLGVGLRFENILYFTRVSHQSEKWLDTVSVSFPFNHDCLVVLAPNSPLVGTSPAAMVGLVGAAAVVCMHEKRSIIPLHNQLCMATIISAWRMVGAKKQLHDNLCMAISGGWIFVGGHQLRCDLVPPTACMVSCRRNTPGMVLCLLCHGWNLKLGWLYLRGTVKFAVSLSYKELRSYLLPQVWFICCFPWLQPETGFTGVVLHAWLR
ncbi:unnamed protein product [Sphenostylis stenocarpa]|uniref:Uncharacterized protein n=1 Tax=Sphenostylis stenocarpa TaxID=92480 RepID=A0AA86W5Q2_9FABA|nr:unnamed protein product [Sphenostylis stenocarpa]